MNGHIILIGYMGSGKTSVGRRLAGLLGRPFEDTDEIIQRERNMTISHIFETRGEAYFRLLESELLERFLSKKEPVVLSTGGGLPIQPENRKPLKQLGVVVYLKTSPKELAGRLEKDTSRPLLAVKDKEAEIVRMLRIREPVYEDVADVTVETDGKTPSRLAREIQNIITENGGFL